MASFAALLVEMSEERKKMNGGMEEKALSK
jgi:hypothetical protein